MCYCKPFASLHHTCIWYSRVDRRPNVCKYFARGPGDPAGAGRINVLLTWDFPCQWSHFGHFSTHWHGTPHVNGQFSERTDMGLPMSIEQFGIFFYTLTWDSPCQWTNFRTHWHGTPHVNGAIWGIFLHTDMGLPMSMDRFPNALTWGSPCRWSNLGYFSTH